MEAAESPSRDEPQDQQHEHAFGGDGLREAPSAQLVPCASAGVNTSRLAAASTRSPPTATSLQNRMLP